MNTNVELKTDTIFVFGSNLAGRHGAGAALYAAKNHGAVAGKGGGPMGTCWGIPTKDASLKPRLLGDIAISVERFKTYASKMIHLTFQVTKIGCGLAGFKTEQIGPLFADCPKNCSLPEEFEKYRGAQDAATESALASEASRRKKMHGVSGT